MLRGDYFHGVDPTCERIQYALDLRRSTDPRSTRSVGTRHRLGHAPNLSELATRGGRRWQCRYDAGISPSLDDKRIRCVRAGGLGACAARNIALGLAAGEIIAYLDDDNVLHEEWLKSVAWGFAQSQASVLYGAFIVDNPSRNRKKDWLPKLYFRDYDHQGLARNNIADMGCIAHRAGLAEAHFDESLREMGDWDLFLRLTKEAPPLPLPAIACYYSTDAPNRSSYGPTHAADKARVREKNKR